MPFPNFHINGGDMKIEKTVPIKKVSKEKRIIYGVVYSPNEPDAHDHFMTAETIEDMAHRFMMASRRQDEQHDEIDGAAVPVESFLVREGDKDFVDENGNALVKSWVLGSKVLDDRVWKKILKGEILSYSISGVGEFGKTKEMNSKWYDDEGNRLNPFKED
jgi:hypothetical protein